VKCSALWKYGFIVFQIPPFGTFLLPLRYKFSFHSFRSAEKQSHIVVIGRRASLVDLCVCGNTHQQCNYFDK